MVCHTVKKGARLSLERAATLLLQYMVQAPAAGGGLTGTGSAAAEVIKTSKLEFFGCGRANL